MHTVGAGEFWQRDQRRPEGRGSRGGGEEWPAGGSHRTVLSVACLSH